MNDTLSFLRALYERGCSATNRQLGRVVDRQEDRVRQWCRRNGLVTYEAGYWVLTDAGIARMTELEKGK